MKALPLFLFAVFATPVMAQRNYETDLGSHIPVPLRARIPDKGDAITRGQVAMTQFARCTVDRQAVRLRRVLALPAEKASGGVWGALADSNCLDSGQMQFRAPLLRGAIFIELVKRRAAGQGHNPGWIAAPWDAKSAAAVESDDMKIQLAMLTFADCVVEADKASATQMVIARPGSVAETAALTALRPRLSECIPAGQQFTMNRMLLQGVLAEVLFRGPTPAMSPESK